MSGWFPWCCGVLGLACGWLQRSQRLTEGQESICESCRGDESEMYVYVLPGHAWCMLMEHAYIHLATVLASICSGTCVFVLFSMLSDVRVTDSIQRADTTRCRSSYPATPASPRGGCVQTLCLCVCVCIPRRVEGVWPLLSPAPRHVCFHSQTTTSMLTSRDTGRYLSNKHTHTHRCTLPAIHGTDHKVSYLIQ